MAVIYTRCWNSSHRIWTHIHAPMFLMHHFKLFFTSFVNCNFGYDILSYITALYYYFIISSWVKVYFFVWWCTVSLQQKWFVYGNRALLCRKVSNENTPRRAFRWSPLRPSFPPPLLLPLTLFPSIYLLPSCLLWPWMYGSFYIIVLFIFPYFFATSCHCPNVSDHMHRRKKTTNKWYWSRGDFLSS